MLARRRAKVCSHRTNQPREESCGSPAPCVWRQKDEVPVSVAGQRRVYKQVKCGHAQVQSSHKNPPICKRTSEGEAMRDATRDDSPPRASEVRAHRASERARRSEARRGSTLALASKTMRLNMCAQQKQSVYMTWTVHVQAFHLRNREKRANEGGRRNARGEALLTAWLQQGREPTREVRPKTREESSSAHSLLWVRAGGAGRHNPSADFFLAARGEAARKITERHRSAPLAFSDRELCVRGRTGSKNGACAPCQPSSV